MESKRNTITLVNKTHLLCNVSLFPFLICTMVFCSIISIASPIPCKDTRCPMLANADIDFEELKGNIGQTLVSKSVPPICNSKCCQCTPCKPALCLAHNGGGMYYPERWLCKCGNKFYDP